MALFAFNQGTSGFDTLPPELQQEIFDYLVEECSWLFSAIQVSKTWHNCCINMLWCVAWQSRLGKVSTMERKQHYANMINEFVLDGEGLSDSFDGIQFPLLREMNFMRGSLSTLQLRRCLQADLHTLQFQFCRVDADTFEIIGKSCLQLQELDISGLTLLGATHGHFGKFLQNLQALRRVHLTGVSVDFMEEYFVSQITHAAQLEELSLFEDASWDYTEDSKQLNAFLAKCTSLRKLRLDGGHLLSVDTITRLSCLVSLELLEMSERRLDDSIIGQWQEQISGRQFNTRNFPSILTLVLSGSSLAITPFVSSARQTLVDLELDVDDNIDSICPLISGLSNLVRLSLLFDEHRNLPRTDMDAISTLSKLQKCHIDKHDSTTAPYDLLYFEAPWFTDQYFNTWISKLPKLQSLRLGLDSPAITQSSMNYLADSCPLLTECQLMWEHDLDTWTSLKAPLFPNLKIMWLGRIEDHSWEEDRVAIEEDAIRDIEVIRLLAPNLQTLVVERSREHENALAAAFRASS